MSKINMDIIKEKYNNGINAVTNAAEKADDITVNPKIDASLTLKSKNSDSVLFDCKFKFDKEFSLLKLIYAILAVVGAFITASVIVNTLFAIFNRNNTRKKSKKERKLKSKADKKSPNDVSSDIEFSEDALFSDEDVIKF